MTTAKVRDSYRVLHFLRNNLYEGSYNPKVVHRSEDTILDMEILKARKFSVQDSGHYTDYSLGNLYNPNEHTLLDVEDMEKVYHKVREELKLSRPKVTIHQKTNQYAEIEKKLRENHEFREAFFKKISSKKKNTRNFYTNLKDKIQAEHEAIQEEAEEEQAIGKFKYKVTLTKGHKVKYEVIAIAKRDVVIKKTGQIENEKYQEIKEKENNKENDNDKIARSDTSRGEGRVIISEEAGPDPDKDFFEIPVYQVDEMKKKDAYTPILTENLDIEQRMMKRWNPPKWMQFTMGQVRRNTQVTLNEFDRTKGESEVRLIQNKAHGTKNDYNENYAYTNDVQNMSAITNLRDLSFDREYEISLKSSSPTKPKVKLKSVLEKIDDKRQVFKKTMSKNVEQRDVAGKIVKILDEYNRLNEPMQKIRLSMDKKNKKNGDSPSPKNANNLKKRNSRMIDKPVDLLPNNKFSSFSQSVIEESKAPIQRRQTRIPSKGYQLGNCAPKSPSKKADPKTTPNILLKTTEPDSDTFVTQNNDGYRDPIRIPLQKKDSTISSFKAPSEDKAESIYQAPRSSSEVGKNVRGMKIAINLNNSIDSKTQRSKSEKKSRPPKNPNFDEVGNIIRKVEVNCEKVEESFNKTCQDFMKIKVESNQKFRAALNVLREDRPVTNMIRYKKYDSRDMYGNDIDQLREQAELERIRKFSVNESQRKEYNIILDEILREEQAPSKLKACIFFFNIFKGLLERGDVLDRQKFLTLLNKIDDPSQINNIFLGVVEKFCLLLNCPHNLIQNETLKHKLEAYKEFKRGASFAMA